MIVGLICTSVFLVIEKSYLFNVATNALYVFMFLYFFFLIFN